MTAFNKKKTPTSTTFDVTFNSIYVPVCHRQLFKVENEDFGVPLRGPYCITYDRQRLFGSIAMLYLVLCRLAVA